MKRMFLPIPQQYALGGGHIRLPRHYSRLDILAEVCAQELAKLKREKQQSCRRIGIPKGLVIKPPPLTSSQDKGEIKKGDFLRMAASMMPWSSFPVRRDDEEMFSKERSLKKPKMSLAPASPDSVLSHLVTGTKRRSDIDEQTLRVAKKKKKELKNNGIDHQGPNPPPGMPAEFKNKIFQLAGPKAIVSEEKLLIQKELTLSDIKKDQNRLTIPTKRMKESMFLTDDEEILLATHNGKNVGSLDNVTLIEPSLERGHVSLRRWKMDKDSGSSSISYVITKTWNGIRERHELKEGMLVQVWAVRVGGELWLALIRLPDDERP